MAIRPPHTRADEWPSRYHGRRMTEAQFLALPEVKPYLEYVDGVVLQKPMPKTVHGRLQAELARLLGNYASAVGAGSVATEARTALGPAEGYRVPDLSYWLPGRPSGDDSIPSITIEIRSPGQALSDLRDKCRGYRESGVDACWLVDPDSRTIEVFEGESGVPLGESAALTSRLLPDFELPLKQLFAVLDDR
jgi:Uma2 family endonuclease